MRSPQPTSAIEPSDTMLLKPTRSRRLQSRIAVMSAPLWPMNATRPRPASVDAKVAFKPDTGLMTPRQFGPMSRMSWARAWSTSARSSAAPSGPTSLKPAEMTMTLPIPAPPHSATRSRDRRRRRHDDRELDLFGDVAHARMGRDAEDGRAGGIDGVDRAAEGAADEVRQDRPADAAGLVCRSDERDRTGREERPQGSSARRWRAVSDGGRGRVHPGPSYRG